MVRPGFLPLWLLPLAVALPPVHHQDFQPDHVLRVSAATIDIGCQKRLSAVVNGTTPGPELRISPGRSTWIRVYNDMPHDNLTMHWHGLAQSAAIFSDGSPKGSQWPIEAGRFFDYEIYVTDEEAGSYFYHSHVGVQALTVFGALVVESCAPPPHSYDEERILLWSDLFNKTDKQIEDGLVHVPFEWSGETQGVLLNGVGVGADAADAQPSRSCRLPVIDVDPGKTYLLRFIGATGLSLLSIAFEAHDNLTVVKVDGMQWVQPVSVGHVQIASGQRYDVLFRAKSPEELRAAGKQTYLVQFESQSRPTTYTGFAVLRYAQDAPLPAVPAVSPVHLPALDTNWLEYQLRPLDARSARCPTLAEVTRRVVIPVSQLTDPASGKIIWNMGNQTWTENSFSSPALVDIYKRGDAAVPDYDAAVRNGGWDPRTGLFAARVGEVLEIVFQNTGSLVSNNGGVDAHPMHAHGQHVLEGGSGDGLYDADENEKRLAAMDYRVALRDTSILYRYAAKTGAGQPAGWRMWRIRVSDPGIWMVHCHTLQHMIMGMQSVWAVGTAADIQRVPYEYISGYLDFGGSAYGNLSYSPRSVHEFSDVNKKSQSGCEIKVDSCTRPQ
ncbi:uncharacterized protein UV8b_08278 [Ustilaginoidea virens]|uniref:L-ascorbate oxidase n=1 Tax=Ustilaginoidea virens TaxID=1159556 RepID=A0A8E5MLS0_USTVR|nr:uncharacterized protein UV8b_08278 [Ustilaginoidea virens]QUC24037.1 hypothetical protein UV8b_08278 [Ustilaginoidea virens]